MTKKMLIDAAHAEETRVVVMDGSKIEDFDFESSGKKQLRGNIYLAKVTRVEPSLQAAFIEYGGNRHGFLSFDEIHPDYYQIPAADREALLAEEAAAEAEHRNSRAPRAAEGDSDAEGEGPEAHDHDDDDLEEESARRRARLRRRYKIQEVIKRRQIMLVQVVKDERGAKGAALTTYLSLAGRYGVLMPNTARGGGISRKITAAADRKRLKTIVQGLDVPEGMGLIIRTAGAKRTKAEIKRDYDYLIRLWENIRDTTLKSIAPAAIHEEDDLVKRAIRDMYDKEIDGIWVEGEKGFREARDFMRMLMPSQAKKVILHEGGAPLFVKEGVEAQLSQIYSPVVPLRSGGYLVINQTEALVAIDVNSGKSTRERNIESTALKTNMEAAAEAARQLRLRDLAGLIVIDFIDMDEGKNNRAVEKIVKDALAFDRARVQMGKISGFGLMEISRQRRRTGVLEGTTHVCEHCQGMGRVRSVESSALASLRALDIEAVKGSGELVLRVPTAVAVYILNHKREYLTRLEAVQGLFVEVRPDASLTHTDFAIDWVHQEEPRQAPQPARAPIVEEALEDDFDDEDLDDSDDGEEEADGEGGAREPRRDQASSGSEGDSEGGRAGRGRRRRRRGGGRPDEKRDETPRAVEPEAKMDGDDASGRRRRRGRRGGRRPREEDQAGGGDGFVWTRPRVPFDDPFQWHDPAALDAPRVFAEPRQAAPAVAEAANDAPGAERPPRERGERGGRGRGRSGRASTKAPADEIWVELPAAEEPVQAAEPVVEVSAEPALAKKPSRSRKKADAAPATDAAAAPSPEAAAAPEPEAPPKRRAPSRKKAVEAEAVADAPPQAPEPAPEPPPAPAPREPDPAEITSKPAAPKRGWWRRG